MERQPQIPYCVRDDNTFLGAQKRMTAYPEVWKRAAADASLRSA
jgi:hypothetical protein